MWKLIIQYGIQLVLLILKDKMEKDSTKKAKYDKVIKDVEKAMKAKDNSKLTAAFARAKKIK